MSSSNNSQSLAKRLKDCTYSQALVVIANTTELFKDETGEAYSTYSLQNDIKQTWPVRSSKFREFLNGVYYNLTGRVATAQAFNEALNVIEARAKYGNLTYPVYRRVAYHDGCIYIDLCDDEWNIVKISKERWEVVTGQPVKFTRTKGMLALPLPKMGNIEKLKTYLNIKTEDDFKIIVAWLTSALRPEAPIPVMVLQGKQGSAKSTTAKMLRSVIDPNIAPLRSPPKDEQDLLIACKNGWVVALDNLSGMPIGLSDALCRISTGSGHGNRKLYTDTDEILFNGIRPIIVNGIDYIPNRSDFLDRSLVIYLPKITDAKRIDEKSLWESFNRDKPEIMGALYTGISVALKNIDSIKLEKTARMADFHKWVEAGSSAYDWEHGEFSRILNELRYSSIQERLETDDVALVIRKMMSNRQQWTSNASDLLAEMSNHTNQASNGVGSPYHIKLPTLKKLKSEMERLAPDMEQIGICIEYKRKNTGSCYIITKKDATKI